MSSKFCLRLSVTRIKLNLSSLFYTQGSLVQGNINGGYVCFSQHRIKTAFSLSLLRAFWYKVNKVQSFGSFSLHSRLDLPLCGSRLLTTILGNLRIPLTGLRSMRGWFQRTISLRPNSTINFAKISLWNHSNNLEVSRFVFKIPFVINITQLSGQLAL